MKFIISILLILSFCNLSAQVDTVYIFRDTCDFGYKASADTSYVLVLSDSGGVARFPDSVFVYQSIFGAAQPHITMKETAPRMYRFTRYYTINKVSTAVRFTLYKSGAWIRELKNAAGVYEIWNYPIY